MYKKYWDYLKYILEHKKNVFKVCVKKRMWIHAITHDMSKLLPSEFFPYANWFYGDYGVNWEETENPEEILEHGLCELEYEAAWKYHKLRNKHHWGHWFDKGEPMPIKYVKQMLVDFEAMSLKFKGSAKEYYINNMNEIMLDKKAKQYVYDYFEISLEAKDDRHKRNR